jgi:hypothetical protein
MDIAALETQLVVTLDDATQTPTKSPASTTTEVEGDNAL